MKCNVGALRDGFVPSILVSLSFSRLEGYIKKIENHELWTLTACPQTLAPGQQAATQAELTGPRFKV